MQMQSSGDQKIKIAVGGQNLDPNRYPYNEQDQKMQQMNSFNNPIGNNFFDMPMIDDDQSEYDEFAEIKFDIEWMQKAWLILGTLWYHEEAGAFLRPVLEEELGDFYDNYIRTIIYPMDFGTMKAKMVERMYADFDEFKTDVTVVL